MALNMLVVGHRCAFYRKKVLKCTQVDVANETGFSVGNISAFETGRNDSSLILLWYMCHGMTLDMITGGVPVA